MGGACSYERSSAHAALTPSVAECTVNAGATRWPDSPIIVLITAYHQRRCVETYRRDTMVMSLFVKRSAFGRQVSPQQVHISPPIDTVTPEAGSSWSYVACIIVDRRAYGS